MFDDPVLVELIEASLQCYPDMQIAEYRVNLAYSEALEAKSRLLPHIFLLGDIFRKKVSDFSSEHFGAPERFTEPTLMFNAFYEVDIWKKNRALFFAEMDHTFAAVADRAEAKLILSISVAQAYFNLQFHRKQLVILKERIERKQEIYALLLQQFANKIISEFRIYEVDSEVALLQDFAIQLAAMIEIDEHLLQALVGNSCCAPLQMECLEPEATLCGAFPLPETLPCDLLARRPDVIAKRWMVEASSYRVYAQRAKFYPSLDLLGYIGFQSFRLMKFFTNKAFIFMGEAAGALPIFTAGKLSAELSQEEQRFEIAIQEYNKSVLTAVKEVENGMTELVAQDDRRRQALRRLEDAQNLFRLTKSAFDSGTKNRLFLLNSVEDVLLHQDLVIKIDLARFEAALSLIRAIGGGYFVSR